MATQTYYDLRITKTGFFALFGHQTHTPANVAHVSVSELNVIESQGWTYDVLREYTEEVASNDLLSSRIIKQFILNSIDDLSSVRGAVSGDHIFVLNPIKRHYIVDITES